MVEIAEDTPDFLLIPSFISRQLLYLAGPLQAAPRKAAAKNDAKVDVLGKHRNSKTGKLYVRYRYAGTLVLDNGLQDVVKIRLPPSGAESGEPWTNNGSGGGKKSRRPYFWAPRKKAGRLAKAVASSPADATTPEKRTNPASTTPAYERLANGNGEIRIVLTFG